MKVLVCGDRHWTDREFIKQYLSRFAEGTIIIHGACRGADLIGASVAKELGLEVVAYPANWSLGVKAGPLRNREMLDTGPNLVLAFHDDIENSKGTKDCVEEARARKIRVEICKHESNLKTPVRRERPALTGLTPEDIHIRRSLREVDLNEDVDVDGWEAGFIENIVYVYAGPLSPAQREKAKEIITKYS